MPPTAPPSSATTPVYNAVKERAQLYLCIFREVSRRYGRNAAISVMRSASRDHGTIAGRALAHLGPNNFAGMAASWARAPDDGATFLPDIQRLDAQGLEVVMRRCPLKDAWSESACDEDELQTLLYCASAYDEAMLTAAGFDFDIELWSPGRDGCCRTRLFAK